MSDIWIYRRRPSSLVRYRHGGAAAFDPAMRSPLVDATAYTGTGTGAAVVPAAREDDKILHFPAPKAAARPKRGGKPGPRRPKPPKPKRRDS